MTRSPQELAEEAAARARRGRPVVTEADQVVARAFGRAVPELTEAEETQSNVFGRPVPELQPVREAGATPEDEMQSLLIEYRQLQVSRLGCTAKSADALAAASEALMSDLVTEAGRPPRRVVTRPERLRQLREKVAALRADVPLSAGADNQPSPSGITHTAQEVAEANALADEAVANAFGRTTKGGGRQ